MRAAEGLLVTGTTSHRRVQRCRAGIMPQVAMMAVAALIGAAAGPAQGAIITGLNGTGLNYSASAATPDASWSIAALPASFTTGTQTPAYPAWIFTGGAPPFNIPSWLGGTSNSGTLGSRWIGVQANTSAALLPNAMTGDYYSVIFKTTFQASAAGVVPFDLRISVDNRATVFLGGTITGTATDRPTITGGQQIGGLIWNTDPPNGTPRAFQQLQSAAGTAGVVEGENTLYVVVDDYISVPNVNPQSYGSIGLLVVPVMPVPEPSTSAMALAAIAVGGWRMGRRVRTQSVPTNA